MKAKEPKTYHYYTILGDLNSQRIDLTQEELYDIELNLSRTVSENVRNNVNTLQADKDAAKLLSVSYYCLGGNNPCTRGKGASKTAHNSTKRKVYVPYKFQDQYNYYFIVRLLTLQKKFDRSKGCWTQYVKWAVGQALKYTISYMRKQDALNIAFADIYEYMKTYEADQDKYYETFVNQSDWTSVPEVEIPNQCVLLSECNQNIVKEPKPTSKSDG